MQFGFLKFKETCMERVWGGTQLRAVLGKDTPQDKIIGESWLISDHELCQSVVCEGPFSGQTLHDVMEQDVAGMLGIYVHRTPKGRFPLLLKLIDAGETLSVQVHPDDEQARQLGENDVGKTEMWYILGVDKKCRIILGFQPHVTRALFEERLKNGNVRELMGEFEVSGGEAIFVPAGTLHAIGGGALLAEIQQNSNITYRLFDYNRLDQNGEPRELHIDKGLKVTRFDALMGGCVAPLRYASSETNREILSACRYFAVEKVALEGMCACARPGKSFHIVLALDKDLTLTSELGTCILQRGEAALVPANLIPWQISGTGSFLDYFVPDLYEDVTVPLRRHGYTDSQIATLCDPQSRALLFP